MMNMLDNYVSRNKTQQALQKYLQAHSFGSATAADLWEAFDQVQVSLLLPLLLLPY